MINKDVYQDETHHTGRGSIVLWLSVLLQPPLCYQLLFWDLRAPSHPSGVNSIRVVIPESRLKFNSFSSGIYQM
jgi:hypothetical protein